MLEIDRHRYYSWRGTWVGACIVVLLSLVLGAWLYLSDYEIDQLIYPRYAVRMDGFTKKLRVIPDVQVSQVSVSPKFGRHSRPVGAEGTPAGGHRRPLTVPDSVWLARCLAMPRYKVTMIPIANYEFCDDYQISDLGLNVPTAYVVCVMKYVREQLLPEGE